MSDTTRMVLIALGIALLVVVLLPLLFMSGNDNEHDEPDDRANDGRHVMGDGRLRSVGSPGWRGAAGGRLAASLAHTAGTTAHH